MKKIWLFCMLGFICGVAVLITTGDLFSQRGMKIKIRTQDGKVLPLYRDSYALVVGNGSYTNGWEPLTGTLQDVKAVKTTLKKHGFHVTLKTDLSKAAFDRAFAEFVLTSGEDTDNRLLFYYAGHGYTRKSASGEDLGYLVMVDAPDPNADKVGFELESIAMESLVTQAEKILSRHVLFVFDSCFSGTILNARDRLERPESISDNIKHPVRQFITAGRAGEVVPDHSDFNQAFLDMLEGRADEPFADGYITGEELGFYLKHKVPEYNPAQHPQYGKIRNPKLDKGDFVFVLEKPAAPGVEPLPTIATLDVTSTPVGATVYLDGNRIGSTPLREYKIDTGVSRQKTVEVGLELSGYESQVVRLLLKGGSITPWKADLKKIIIKEEIIIIQADPSVSIIPAGMVRIPAGEFQMGSNKGGDSDEKPVHTVYVDAFYMDKYEVTVGQYKAFVRSTGHPSPDWSWVAKHSPTDQHPMIDVSWHDAMAYAVWSGKRLPTEAEWEYAARGGLAGKKYPWGNTIDAGKASYNFNVGKTTPVGRYAANGYGLYDMAGNVMEWCLDAYDENFYVNSPRRNPLSGVNNIKWLLDNHRNIKSSRVLRGGTWRYPAWSARVASRSKFAPTLTHYDIGFRCVRSVSP